jgi:uncharacterized protein YaaN involved in tellurite resistance
MTENTAIVPEVLPQDENKPAVPSKELAPLSTNSLSSFPADVQREIVALSEQINVTEIENVMSYGSIPLLRSFEQAGKILQDEAGSSADQMVIKEVIELSKQANDSYEDFNLVLKEPNFLEKLFLKISKSAKDKHDADVKYKAITNYKLLEQLMKSCDTWVEMLKDGWTKIHTSAMQDKLSCEELEKYIVAGRIAEQRIAAEVEQARLDYELSGLIADKEKYDNLKDGYETLQVVLLNLEKSRAAFVISIGQLFLQAKANKNTQIAVRTQRSHSMALASQQLRNAVLNAKTKIAIEGQKSLSALNSELMKKVSENTVLTAEESEKILLNGVYSVEAALEAAKTVIEGCDLIKKAREERAAEIEQELGKLENILTEIAPFVTRLKSENEAKDALPDSSSNVSGGLKF